MKESTQTLLFLFAALASVVVATQVQPSDATYEVDDLIGKPLFPPFEAEAAKSMRIVRFNEETATLREFEVAEEDGVWSIPSKGGYPADAERQMAEASAGVIDLEILSIATQSAADHEEYGVVEPSSELEVGATGVGTKVTLTSGSGQTLVDVVIGKPVKGAEDQHYVRRTTQDVVFTVAIDPEKFSTTFDDWIEDDLLDLEAWDVARAEVHDYSAELVMQGFRPAIRFDPRGEYVVDFDEDDNAWRVVSLRSYNEETQSYEEFDLADDEELNQDALRELKTAVGDLRIVDVERKPSGLSADLKAGEDFFDNRGAIESLMERGFAPTRGEGEATDVLSSEGEVLITTKGGVEYVLRFGNLQLSADEQPDAANPAEPGDDPQAGGVNRYLFVMARVNEDLLEKPELETLPDEQATDPAEDGASDEEAGDEETSDDDGEAAEGETAEDADEGDSREEVEKRNQRAQDEYDAKVADARERVEELNARFGDWYYVIADDVYKKIAIGRDELIQTADAEEEGDDDSESTGPSGPLGATGPGIPGLPDVPGVQFNPMAGDTEETAGEESASDADEAADAEESEESMSEDQPTEGDATEEEGAEEDSGEAEDSETDEPTEPAPTDG